MIILSLILSRILVPNESNISLLTLTTRTVSSAIIVAVLGVLMRIDISPKKTPEDRPAIVYELVPLTTYTLPESKIKNAESMSPSEQGILTFEK
ncbi:hypothetical protein KsCSTR_49390 [Candidatus Kuenenia stuttgartiensis]|nr:MULTISPECIES: hypothetical protein [Kuenenia]MCZ7621675.1 hypothetical protein [Candidatus Kuenenia sp.]QII14316.1 hypothetical protein KsCSTR_49390 [Candidatus Kuenenia stuttgartiensis]